MYAFKTAVLGMLVAASLTAQTTDLDRAQQALTAADMAGAGAFAKTLYDDAAYRARFAQENWNSNKESVRNEAHMRAIEATVAAQAAAAKARWLSTNAAIHGLQGDITRFGGTSNVTLLAEESPTMPMNHGATTKDRIAAAQYAVDQAKVAGAMDNVPDNEIRIAESYIESAKRVSKGTTTSDVADDLSYRAEMIGRRAFYLARLAQSTKVMPGLQLDRTRLAQAASERQAAAERAQREAAERRSAELQQQLAAEQANRQAQSAEVERLHQQIDENRRAAEAQVEADRQARIAAERQLEEAYGKYTTTITTAAPSDVDAMRRQIEDQQLALRTIQDREHANAESMQAEIARLRTDLTASQQAGTLSADLLAQRQADILARQQQLDTLRHTLEAEAAARAQRDKQDQEAIAAAQVRRQQADAEAAALRQQAESASQRANAAQEAAQEMSTQAVQARAQAEQARAQAEQAQAAAQSAQTQLEETRRQLAQSDAETRRLRIQNELSRIASTRSESRGLIVTLNGGILFDTGKTALKPGAKSTLSKIAKQLQTDPSLKIAVEGNTDNVGSTATNQSLSEKRANAVRDYLVSAGISSDSITATGKGEESPIATNKTAAGRQQNRRVELVITQ
ncbi:MAG TPA: OmpA family protein [Thermoanaerobaculia bacterium]|jgi:outer membrane protein OmpA-like peptidoglycan-associated protein|nr:OmpA family protein [Thermoanaerobaculia bacterium]